MWQAATCAFRKAFFRQTLTFCPASDNLQSIFPGFVKPRQRNTSQMKSSFRGRKWRHWCREKAQRNSSRVTKLYRMTKGEKKKKIQKYEDLFCSSNLRESGPILMICN